MDKKRIVTGYRPTGKMHIGHWFGNMLNMIKLQEESDSYYFVADYHALTSDWEDSSHLRDYTDEMVLDWVAAGLDPEKCCIYRQSDIPEVVELSLFMNFVTPMSWLERVPSYKDQKQQISAKDLSNVGFFLYPSLMSADIAIVGAEAVPVGEDQVPHLELTREIIRRLNRRYGTYLVEPEAYLSEAGARVPGIDGRKMSKSYGNAIFVSDSPDEMRKKAMQFMTDPARKLRTDPGDPSICPLHQIHKLVGNEVEIANWDSCCRAASCGCVDHKRAFAEDLVSYFADFQARRVELEAIEGFSDKVLEEGAARARVIAKETVAVMRELIGLDKRSELSAGIVIEDQSEESAPSYLAED